MKTKLLILTAVVLLIGVAGVVWVAIAGWPPIIIRDSKYRELLSNFQQAQLKSRINGDKDIESDMAGWDFQIERPERQTPIQVKAIGHMGVVWVKYSDENNERKLYEYFDYSHVREIRIAQNVLYVSWAETLFRTDYWLMAYDLANRREIVRCKIDPQDLK